MIKALFFDLDGTLLNTEKKISQANLEALKECKSRDIKLYLATARPPSLERTIGLSQEVLQLFDGGIYCNGACIKMGKETEYSFLSPQVAKEMIKSVEPYPQINMAWQLPQNKHAFRHPIKPEFYQNWGVQVEDILSIDESLADQVVKALIFEKSFFDGVDEVPTSLVACLIEDCLEEANIYWTDQGKLVQITDITVHKEQGIEKVRKSLALSKNEIAVFGDDVNDHQMLSAYPNSVAMGNAIDYIKNIAGHVTLSHDEEGIAHAIRHILKLC